MALHKPVQDHREKRHPHHEGKPVYYPENVVEVLEVHWRCLMWSPISCGHREWCLADQRIATPRPMYMKVAAQIEFYCDRGEGGTMRPVDRHMAVSSRRRKSTSIVRLRYTKILFNYSVPELENNI
jgi:hypothetical protein